MRSARQLYNNKRSYARHASCGTGDLRVALRKFTPLTAACGVLSVFPNAVVVAREAVDLQLNVL